jgi:hypothetical protein
MMKFTPIKGAFAVAIAFFCVSAAMSVLAETGKNETLWREFVYDKPDMTPIFYGGESRAQDVHASDYCIYLDVYHPDGSATWAERADFTQGTHDWEKMMGALVPKKPVSKIQVYAVCRNGKNVDKAEFRNFFLERREVRASGFTSCAGLLGAAQSAAVRLRQGDLAEGRR